ncbi:Uncharacterised protein [Peptostreptococcus anaerobius]|uniref:Uncharacterized protein n=1 Tax=Peptostreptococcus anaerobius TaxID=1261 RepID=A0A379CI66_9FIRM|nr:hypothetical protein [Peptostreptococcus anaerobius]SFN18220.1 hypothetical protein SAMN05660467_01522 [Peptostreptococcus anaerobius]SUB62111.1 Uncharacterised protein [Peptostreptococcus anaerobius]
METKELEKYINEKVEEFRKDLVLDIKNKVKEVERPKTIWDLKIEDGETYYNIRPDGYIRTQHFNSIYDCDTRDMGNALLTKEEAEFEVERLKILAIMKKYSRPFKKEDENWVISFDETENFITYDIWWDINFSVPIFESREMAQKVVEEIGEDRLKKYYFRLE